MKTGHSSLRCQRPALFQKVLEAGADCEGWDLVPGRCTCQDLVRYGRAVASEPQRREVCRECPDIAAQLGHGRMSVESGSRGFGADLNFHLLQPPKKARQLERGLRSQVRPADDGIQLRFDELKIPQ